MYSTYYLEFFTGLIRAVNSVFFFFSKLYNKYSWKETSILRCKMKKRRARPYYFSRPRKVERETELEYKMNLSPIHMWSDFIIRERVKKPWYERRLLIEITRRGWLMIQVQGYLWIQYSRPVSSKDIMDIFVTGVQ